MNFPIKENVLTKLPRGCLFKLSLDLLSCPSFVRPRSLVLLLLELLLRASGTESPLGGLLVLLAPECSARVARLTLCVTLLGLVGAAPAPLI